MTREELGHTISELRNSKGYSIRELADRCEVNKATIVNIEKGRFSPRFEIVEKLLNELGAEIIIKRLGN